MKGKVPVSEILMKYCTGKIKGTGISADIHKKVHHCFFQSEGLEFTSTQSFTRFMPCCCLKH